MNENGSEWRKWDLHIHSDASDGNASCADIVRIAKENGIEAIALTDHHTAKNIDTLKKIAKEQNLAAISGIEFRSEYGDKSVHFIGLFPDKHDGLELNTKSLTELILNPLGLSDTTIIAKGKEKKPGASDEQAFKEGMFLLQVPFKKAADLIHKFGGIVVVHAGSKENGIDAEMKHKGISERNTKTLYDSLGTVKEELFRNGYIDICEIRKENDSEQFYLENFRKPSIIASDAHSGAEIGSKYAWIKADLTFDGLCQILYEPESRVKISDTVPEQKSDYLVIDRVTIDHPDFGNQTITFNQNLNCIIGGRSSGKSILLGSIAKKIGTNKDVKPGKQEYNTYITETLVPVITVKWRDGIDDTSRKIDYFPQTYINSLAADSSEIVTLIETIVKVDPEKKAILEAYNASAIKVRAEINNEVSNYFQILSVIQDQKNELLALGSKEGIKKQIEILEKELVVIKGKMEASISKDEEDKYNEQSREIIVLTNDNVRLTSEANALALCKAAIRFDSIADSLAGLSEENKTTLGHVYEILKKEINTKWSEKIDELLENTQEKKATKEKRITEIESNAVYLKCKQYYSENKAYLEVDAKLKNERTKVTKIVAKEDEIIKNEKEMRNKKEEIIRIHDEYYLKCNEVTRKIQFRKEDVEIKCSVQFANSKFGQTMGDKFNQRSFEIQAIVNYKYDDNDKYKEFLSSIFDKIVRSSIPLKAGATPQQAIIDIFTNSYYDISYDVIYDNDSLSQMSEGKKAFVIMRMLLDFNENGYPILIDQPEDDLDNRAIYDELVKYIRIKKTQRQIIIVTHNPNIVVGGDSELVICANQDGIGNRNKNGVRFEYCSGSLEHTKEKDAELSILESQGIREHVCDILEGGDEAFLKRELKYRIRRK